MPLTHAIAHHLTREGDTDARLTLRDGELTPEGPSESLFSQLKGAFLSRLSRQHGSFSREGEISLLQRELEAHIEGKHSLSELSEAVMNGLKAAVDNTRAAINVHCLFFVEKSLDHHHFYLFVAGLNESLTLNEALEVTTSHAIDSGHTLFGIKVDLAEWRERGDYAYLSLLPPRGNPALSEAFTALTGFANGLNKEESTLAFLEGVEAFARQVPQEKVDDFRSQVVEYCVEQDGQDAPVDLRRLSRSVEGIDADEFVRVVAGHTAQGEQEVMMDRRSLRRYVKFAGREKDLAISFNSYQLNKRVRYDADSDTLSITGLPKALRKQLLEHGSEG